MAQAGHESAAMALEVYAKAMERKRDTGERLDALVKGADWEEEDGVIVTARPATSVSAADRATPIPPAG